LPQPAGPLGRVVAVDAILTEQRPLLGSARRRAVSAEPRDAATERGDGDDSAGNDDGAAHRVYILCFE